MPGCASPDPESPGAVPDVAPNAVPDAQMQRRGRGQSVATIRVRCPTALFYCTHKAPCGCGAATGDMCTGTVAICHLDGQYSVRWDGESRLFRSPPAHLTSAPIDVDR